jgi:hypothetical protein
MKLMLQTSRGLTNVMIWNLPQPPPQHQPRRVRQVGLPQVRQAYLWSLTCW